MRIYLDSNVFISYIRNEIGKNFRPLFSEAENFFEWIKNEKHTLIFSNIFIYETTKHCYLNKEEIIQFFKEHSIKTEYIEGELKVKKEILKRGIHLSDAAHITLAINSNCDAIATFNIKDFEKSEDLIKIIDITQI